MVGHGGSFSVCRNGFASSWFTSHFGLGSSAATRGKDEEEEEQVVALETELPPKLA